MATLMRRIEMVIWAPILSSLSRRLPTVASATSLRLRTI